MIATKRELQFYIMADRIMNGLPAKRTLRERVHFFLPPPIKIIEVLRYMRRASYYNSKKNPSVIDRFLGKWNSLMYMKTSMKLGFSIGSDVFGYGLVIPHYGTVVVNSGVRAGNYCVLHTSTCIGGSDKVIGDGLYLAAGAKIMGKLTLGNGVSVASNSLVNKNAGNNVLLAGSPAIVKKQGYPFWWERDGETYVRRVNACESLKHKMGLLV